MLKCEERESVVLHNQGQKIFGVMHLPSEKKLSSAVLICHGFGGNKVGKNRIYVHFAEKLAELGIAVLRLDFRCCGDSEGNFYDITIQGQVSDALLGLQFLEKHKDVDPKRIGVLGISLGGAVSVLASSAYGGVKSLALWAPVASGELWTKEWKELNPNIRLEDDAGFKDQIAGPVFLEQFQEFRLENSLQTMEQVSLLHIHGKKDTTVSLKHQGCYSNWRQNIPEKNRFVTLPNSDHHFTDSDDRQHLFAETLDWFQKTL